MARPWSYLGQLLAYAAFAVVLGYFSTAPAYTPIPAGHALIKLSFSHYGRLVSECRRRSAEELARLAPNMRLAMDCPRERSAVEVVLAVDGKPRYHRTVPPTGLSKDGLSYVYARFPVPAGRHHLQVRLRDDIHLKGFNYERSAEVDLAPAQLLVVEFNPRAGGFALR